MSVYKKNNKFVSYILVLLGLIIVVVFTRGQLNSFQEKSDIIESKQKEYEQKEATLAKLNETKKKLETTEYDIDKYLVEIKEDEILKYLYSNIDRLDGKNDEIVITNITILEPKEMEIGFLESNINLSLRVPNEKKLKLVLDFLTGPKSEYNFIIPSFSYPYGEKGTSYDVNIPLKVLHK